MAKYNNNLVTYDNIKFDSEMERDFYIYLLTKYEKNDIKIQPVFELQPKFTDIDNKKIRAITYSADFQVGIIVFDVKGMTTQQGEMRIKMFKYVHRDLYLKVITKAPKYLCKDWIELDDLKKARKVRKK